MASIDKRPNGTYRARWREYPGGPQVSKTFTRKIDADNHLTKVSHDLLKGVYIEPAKAKVTLGEYVETHLSRQPWRASTKDVAMNALQRHAVGHFGAHRPLGSIRKADVQAFVTGLDLAPSTVATVHQHLSGLLKAAVDDGIVAANAARDVKLPKAGGGAVVPPTAEDVQALYEAADDWFRVAIVLGAGLGLRQAEASGLTADRIVWLGKKRTVRIDRQWVTRTQPHHFATPKSNDSIRSIPASDAVLLELSNALAGRRTGFVLQHAGEPASHHVFQHAWRQAVKKAGVEHGLRFHALRHRFASVLISGGCSIVAVQTAMGHSLPSITLNLYGHLLPADDDLIRASLNVPFKTVEDSLRTEGVPEEA
jgi:integrase